MFFSGRDLFVVCEKKKYFGYYCFALSPSLLLSLISFMWRGGQLTGINQGNDCGT
jgi:hypothetical protein